MIGDVSYLDNGLLRGETATESPLFVIPKDLCTRCGACHVICPPNVIRFDDRDFPYIETADCIDCGLCLKVCPGIEFDMPKTHQEMFHEDFEPQRMRGTIRQAYIGRAKRTEIFNEGSSGGVVTQILISLVNKGLVDGAVVVGNDPDDPTMPVPLIAHNEAEIRATAQSKYVAVANTKVLRELKGTKEKFAFVGMGCQIQGLLKLAELNKRLKERAYVTIGLSCRGTMEKEAVSDLLRVNGIKPNTVKQVAHRDGKFPGRVQAHLKSGEVKPLHRFEIKEAINVLFRMYLADRCHMCPDYSAEFSDITCSDFWLRNKQGKYMHDGATLVICRTERGQEIIESLMESGDLALEPFQPELIERAYGVLRRERKMISYLRIMQRKQRGQRVPDYGVDAAAQVAKMTPRDRWYEFTYRMSYVVLSPPIVKRAVLRFLISPIGEKVVALKLKYKEIRGASKARKAESMALKQGRTW